MKDEGRIFCLRRDVVDVPWLLLRPLQAEDGALWAAEPAESDLALNVFWRMCNIARRGVYAPQESGLPLDALKHHEAGERFAVRNSGAQAVVEGCGGNGCEYMTGGTIVILGEVGNNFGAGMTGGMAFVYDPKELFSVKVNGDSVIYQRVETDYWDGVLKKLILSHAQETGSRHAQNLLDQWEWEKPKFWQICPKEMLTRLKHPLKQEDGPQEARLS